MKRICAVILALTVFFAGYSFSAVTTVYYKGGVLSIEQPDIRVNRIYGLKLKPLNVKLGSDKEETFIPHTIENLSNTTNKIILELIKNTEGWTVVFASDKNGTKLDGNLIELGEGSVYHFFLILKRPSTAKPGDTGSAFIRASGTIKDGAGYIGDNGIIYGGADAMESQDTVIVK